VLDLLPMKSGQIYGKEYEAFIRWKKPCFIYLNDPKKLSWQQNSYFWERIQKIVFIFLDLTKKVLRTWELILIIVFFFQFKFILKVKFFKGGDTFQDESITTILFYKNFILLTFDSFV
jgi:hypothetical protein